MTVPMVAPDDSSRGLGFWTRVRGVMGLLLGLVLIKCIPLWMLETSMKALRRITRPARYNETVRLVQAVRWASRVYPWKAACLEISLAACMASVLTWRLPTWCVGTRFKPVQQHAWVKAEGRLVSEPEADNWPYRPLIQI